MVTGDHAAIGRQAALVNRIRGERFGRWNEDRCGSTSWTRSFLCMVDDLLAGIYALVTMLLLQRLEVF